jgi:RNA polymerase sigma-70 factor (ECF subfamily)
MKGLYDMDDPSNEQHLISQAQAGNAHALSALYQAYVHAIFRYVSYRVESDMVAEDITADVFLRMVREIGAYQPRGFSFGAWLFAIARNRIHDHYRAKRHHTHTALSDHHPSDDTDPFDTLANHEERAQLRAALAQLPPDYQDVLILRFMHGLSYSQVARIMGKSELALRTIQHRALKSLGKLLGMTSHDKPRSYLRGGSDDHEPE